MASIIKNQIIKHLSAFARNLTPDQISVEVLRGKGELRNIELNEAVLTQKLELPPWLKIKRAICNKVTVKVPWTKLKSSPVELYVDEISVIIQLLSSAPTDFRKAASAMTGKSYDLAERVVEGMSLFVLTVDILFESDSFGGSLMFSKLAVESKNRHTWKDEKNLHMTRVHDKQIRQVLFFKQVSWQLLRIEASAHKKAGAAGSEELNGKRRNAINSPLRLITGDGKCRIVIKKDDMTCAMIDGRIEVILEDILWVATLLQVRSAIDFYKHIKDLANAVRKETEKNPFLINQPNQLQKTPLLTPSTRVAVPENEVSKVFKQLDIHQSSHHLHIGKIVLHLFDDSAEHALPENWNTDCGAIQATLYQLSIDYYPAHSVFVDGEFSGRSQWLRYNSPNSFTALASRQLEQHFKLISSNMESSVTERFSRLWPQLNSQNAVIRIKDIVVQCVSEQSTKKEALLDMFCQDKEAKQSIPSNVSFFHLEFTSYFFPASDAYPLPPDSTHLVVGPFEYLVDHRSIRWLVYVFENILNAFEAPQVIPNESELFRPDFRVELIRPRVILTAHEEALDDDPRLPKRFLLNFTKIQCSNFTLINDPALELPIMFKGIGRESLDFVSKSESTLLNVGMLDHLLEKSQPINQDGGILKPRSAHNQWFITVPAVWLSCDFGKSKGFETILVNDICLAGSVVQRSNHIAVMLEPQNTVGVILDHFQFVQLLEMHTKIVALLDQIDLDRQFFAKNLKHLPASTPFALYGLINQIHIRLVLPPGPTPSPYDLNWTKYGMPASATSTSLSSGWLQFLTMTDIHVIVKFICNINKR
ncbi:UHRF1-binding protein 1-like [Ditylenchus destructor]|uniref:UHRF1-binding protein 1-like n=1 Tax=Ditylenchus destructor TaxID=166010 RepID=A0AAD4NHD2_9BILA|nr:UHRF1-binding protein 1-like [Ditylenchus destructor]